jgi:hypothetical protein
MVLPIVLDIIVLAGFFFKGIAADVAPPVVGLAILPMRLFLPVYINIVAIAFPSPEFIICSTASLKPFPACKLIFSPSAPFVFYKLSPL